MTVFNNIEWVIFALNVGYVLLAGASIIYCWPVGIVAATLQGWIMIECQLNAEAGLMLFYVIAGFVGWYLWKRKKKNHQKIKILRTQQHVLFNLIAITFAAGIYFFLTEVAGGNDPILDSSTTAYAILTTWLVAQRVLSNWIYWFIINSATAVLYHMNELSVLRNQMIVFAGLSIVGWLSWKRKYMLEKQNS